MNHDLTSWCVLTSPFHSGLDEGIMTMSKGEKAQYIISPAYAYSDPYWESNAPPKIPRDSAVIFVIELLSFC